MESEEPKEELTATEMENLDKILNKLLSVKKYIFLFIFISLIFYI